MRFQRFQAIIGVLFLHKMKKGIYMKENKTGTLMFALRVLQGVLLGVGAVLPGISGGVLCVAFGIYKPVMEVLSDPFGKFKTHLPLLVPILAGAAAGFLGVARILSFFLEAYPNQSVCLFVGLIAGMLPSLFREAGEKGKPKGCMTALLACFAGIVFLLASLESFSVSIVPSKRWYLFCGFCMALSVIVPGMSFSTLLMPMGLYAPFVDGLGSLNLTILIPAGIGAVLTVVALAKFVDTMMKKHYALVFHGIIGIVIGATVMTVPFSGFAGSFAAAAVNTVCIAAGFAAAMALDHFNSKISTQG